MRVHGQLVQRVEANELGRNNFGDIADGLLHAFADETFLVAVAEFDGFVFAGAGAAGNRRATDRAAAQGHVHFHRWVTARIEDFTRLNIMNFAHFSFISCIFFVYYNNQTWEE